MGSKSLLLLHVELLAVIVMGCICSNTSIAAAPQALDGCRERCRDMIIPYPFGVGEGCYLDKKYAINCNESKTPPAALKGSSLSVTNISLIDGEMKVLQFVAKDCYDETGHQSEGDNIYAWLRVSNIFTISNSENRFTAIGCDTYAIVQGFNHEEERFTTGCMSMCDRFEDINFESCSGIGCCQIASIPSGLKNITVSLASYSNHASVRSFNPCSYAILAEESQFKFTNTSFKDFENRTEFPLVVDWAIGNLSCEEAKTSENFACKANSECQSSKTGFGYLCQCLQGFEGNPYHPQGCQDIDECKDSNSCINGICHNTFGGFDCSCKKGYVLDGKTCSKVNSTDGPSHALIVYVPLGVSIGLIALLAMILMLCWGIRKRRLIKLREKFFEQNGGFLLQQRLSVEKGSFETAKVFTAEELKLATNNYHESRVVGEGGYGTVYKGILPDNRVVAVKKSKVGAQNQTEQQTEQFINEVILLMQINHRNVVRLLGCCLETDVPLLVYEFIANGNLFQHIHKKGSEAPSLSWELRLKIAAETAGALAYLHSETNTTIIHRDVKTMNILLDENYTAKVSDFGTSRLVPLDQDELSTLVQGTIGYLDPEYLQSSQLTEKSDVYSFGVVLAELLTGKKALSFDQSNGASNLAMFFLSLKEDDQLRHVIDNDIVEDGNMMEIGEVANLSRRCLRIKGEERPTMKEVAMELEGLRAMVKHPWGKVNHLQAEETEYLLGAPSVAFDLECGSSSASAVYDSVRNQLTVMPYDDGR